MHLCRKRLSRGAMHLFCNPSQIRDCLVPPAGGGWHLNLAVPCGQRAVQGAMHLSLAVPGRCLGESRCVAPVLVGMSRGGWHLIREVL